LLTREPGGCELGKKLRKILLDDKAMVLDKVSELLLFAADRAQHVAEIIKPALAAGKVVICDRYIDSTTAYQSGGRGFSEEMIKDINNYSITGLVPDKTFLVDVPVELGLQRAGGRNGKDKFESEEISFHHKVRSKYLELAKQEKRIIVLDGQKTIEEVFELIRSQF